MSKPSSALLIPAPFVLVIAFHLLGSHFPGVATWGFSQWSVVDTWGTFFALSLAAALVLKPVAVKISSSVGQFALHLSQTSTSKRVIGVTIVSALLFFLFMSLRLQALVYGDSLTILAHVSQSQGDLIFDQYKTQALSIVLFNKACLLGQHFFDLAPKVTFAAINCIAGVVSFWAIYSIAGILFKSTAGRNAIMFSALSSGAVLLFFGHIETYAWPLALGLWSLYFTIRYTQGLSSIFPSIGFALAAAVFHAIALPFLVAVLAVAAIQSFSSRQLMSGRAYRITFLILVAGSIIFAAVGDFIGLPGVFVSLIPESNNPYWVFSLEHLRDVGNAMFFLAPAGILLLVVSLFQKHKDTESGHERTLALFALATFLPAFWIDPALGAMRDWDILSFYGIPLSIWGSYRFVSRTPGSSHGAIAVAAFVIILVHLTPNIIEKRNPEIAVAFLDAALNDDPHYQTTYLNGDRLLSWGTVLSRMKHSARAKKYYERRILAKRSSREAWYNLGLIHIDDNKYDSAIYCFQNALSYYPHDTTSWYMLSHSHFARKQMPEALVSIRRAEDLNPRDPLIHNVYGIILIELRQYDSAIYHLRISVELDPGSAESRTNFGIAFAMTKQYDSAYHHLKIAQSANPNLVGIYPALLDMELALGKYDECQRDLNYLRKLDPLNEVIRNTEAMLRKARGE